MRISDWSSDVCSSDLLEVTVTGKSAHAAMPYTGHDALEAATAILTALYDWRKRLTDKVSTIEGIGSPQCTVGLIERSEEHTSELQSLMRISYAVFCLKQKTFNTLRHHYNCIIYIKHY